MVTKSMDIYILPKLVSASIVSVYDLWMSKGGIDTYVLVVHYLSKACELVHATIGLFEVNETTSLCMAR